MDKPFLFALINIIQWGCQTGDMIDAESAVTKGSKPVGDMTKCPWLVDINGCGGTLIDSRTVITAAHCTGSSTSYIVKYGHVDVYKSQEVRATLIKMSPKYNGRDNDFDIATLRLEKAIQFNENTRPARLPGASDCKPGNPAIVVGRGLDSFKGVPSLRMPKYKQDEIVPCSTSRGLSGSVCTGKMPCKGDSGGPLVSELGPNAVVYGAVSHGKDIPCGSEAAYGSVCINLKMVKDSMIDDPNSTTSAPSPPTTSGNAPPTSPPNTQPSAPGGSGGSNNAPPPSSGGQSGGSTIWSVSPWIFVTLIALLLVFLCALILCWIFRSKAEKKRALKNKKGRARKKNAVQR